MQNLLRSNIFNDKYNTVCVRIHGITLAGCFTMNIYIILGIVDLP
jgi:hypothetical protein